MKKYIEFIHFCESLKKELRNGRTSTGKNESVADHSWRVAVMVMIFAPQLDKPICLEKALKMALIHDLVEAITGDNPYFIYEKNSSMISQKFEEELTAMQKIKRDYCNSFVNEIFELWLEFELSSSYEAKFIRALDKIEAQIQHNEADFKIWNDFDIEFSNNGLNKYCKFDSFLSKIREVVQEESKSKIAKNSK